MEEVLNGKKIKRVIDTPLRADAFKLTDEEKIEKIEALYADIMNIMGLDLEDENLKETPKRVAKMFINESFSGLNPKNKPEINLFDNDYGYHNMLVEKNITLFSICEHHFVPIIGKVHVAYIPRDKVIGLSKINRLVQYYAKRPQVQERLTIQIAEGLKDAFQHDDVAVLVEADHLCVSSRGIGDTESSTTTEAYSGQFKEEEMQRKFLSHIRS